MLDSTNSNTNMLDPTATVGDFEFAFNDVDLSDRVLRVEIVANSSDSKSDDEGRDAGHPNRKRRRENLENESESEDEATHSDDSDCSPVVDVKTFHISSAILAAKSIFFYKLFKNGMRESQQRDVTLRIHVSEEAALMDILKFMYSNTLSAVTIMSIPHLLSVLIVADKFQIIPCMQYTIELLQEMPMSLESALSYLELPSCVAISEVVQPLIRATKKYLTTRYKNISRSKAELMNLPLSAVEVVLGSDGMQVFSEEEIFNFILEWARKNYPKLEERRDILSKRLVQFVCFPNMDCHKLKEVLICPEFDHNREVYEHVLNALVCKVEGKTKSASRDRSTIDGGFIERIYEGCPVQIVTLQMSRPHYIIYLELKKKQCQAFQSSTILSKPFWIGGRGFTLNSRYEKVQQTSLCLLSLHVFMFEGSGTDILDYEFEVMKKSSEEYESKGKKSKQKLYRFTRGKNLFRTPSTKFMFDDNEYFINGILQLRATLAICDSQT